MLKLKTFAGALGLSLLLGGCAGFGNNVDYTAVAGNDFVSANYRAADALQTQLRGKLDGDKPLIMATIVNIDALEQSSMLGRVVSEQISTRLAQAGLPMLEMKLRNSVYLKRHQGELMLTRELGEVAGTHKAQAVVVGSYAETRDTIFINIKVIQPTTNLVLAGHDYVLAKQGTIRSMLVPD
ncbi:FlgO family outer membrane protein [Massilia sp. YIM B02443]|uniref:FlgO family outer membrane protein n=1 Tax=Massilia sp. YIM B02443 TaxID=3050127 RepID=UPI0025B63C2D|nr:FlgO family outer membrane protein [Massilia sp. YIM B02443]MDN4040133.1 FlgO family outer membrane protein [Massilia sp. YIM B02443]